MSPSSENFFSEVLANVRAVSEVMVQGREHERLARRQQQMAARLLANSMAPQRHLKTCPQFDHPEWGKRLQTIMARLASKRGVIIGICGRRGAGKTQMAVEAIRRVTQQGQPALFTSAVGFFMAVKGSYGPLAKVTEAEVVERYVRPQLLVVDELAKRTNSDWEQALFYEVLNRRYNAERDTILTANLPAAEFTECVGDSTASRMSEGGGVLDCQWPSFRNGLNQKTP